MEKDDPRQSITRVAIDEMSASLPRISGSPRRQAPTLPPGPLVGRNRERSLLRDVIFDSTTRITSVLGPGGVGKTRLALTVTHELAPAFDDGVLFVRLDQVTTESLSEAIGRHLGLTPSEGTTWADGVVGSLGRQRLLLVLDNCESMIDAMDELPELLKRCPNMVVLATSRETLRLSGEREVWLSPLETPDAAEALSLADLTANPAVHLFVLRAAQVRSDFIVTRENSACVAGIVQRLDGLPLAIELAAAHLRHLSPEDVLTMLNDAMPALAGGARSLPERQQSLRTMVRWSLEMLPPEMSTDTLRLAVFPGTFTPESVATVIESGSRQHAWNLLLALADKSLITRASSRDGTETTFFMLQTVRSVVREALEARPELLARTLHRRAEALVAFAHEADRHYHGPKGVPWLRHMRQHHADVHAIIEESITRPDLRQKALQLCGDMFWFWYTQGHYRWALPRIETLLDLAGPDSTPQHRARAHVTAGWLAHRMAQIERSERHFHAAKRLFGPEPDRGSLLGNIGYAYVLSFDRQDTPGAIRLLEEVIAKAPAVDNAWHEEAAGHFGIGILRYFDDQLPEARIHFTETVKLGRAHSDAQSIGMSLMYLAHVDRAEGSPADAFWKLREALPLLMEIGDLATTALLLDIVASTLAELNANHLGTEALAVGEHLRTTMGIPRSPLEQPEAAETRTRLGTGFGEDAANGRTIDLGKTIDRLLRFRPEETDIPVTDQDGDAPVSSAHLNLSPRELEVLHLIARGMTSPEIAATLFVSPHTIKRHMANIRRKLGVKSQAAAVAALREPRQRPGAVS